VTPNASGSVNSAPKIFLSALALIPPTERLGSSLHLWGEGSKKKAHQKKNTVTQKHQKK
jgi:hypothetical protein